MEKLVSLVAPSKAHNRRERSESPGSIDLNELVYISKISSSSVDYDNETEHRGQRLGDLRIPQTPPGLETYSFHMQSGNYTPSPRNSQDYTNFNNNRPPLRVPELGDHLRNFVMSKSSEENIRLNLSCKKISILSTPLSNTLIELNLSHNRITRFPNLEDTDRLEYLNMS